MQAVAAAQKMARQVSSVYEALINGLVTGSRCCYAFSLGCRPALPLFPPAPRVGIAAPFSSDAFQRLIEVGNQVINMLDADREANHVFGNAGLGQLCG